jgi:hypothetical protein
MPLPRNLATRFFVFGGALAGVGLLFFDLGHFGFELGLGGSDIFLAGLGVDHEFEDFVFLSADFLFGELDFVQQSLVLVVGFYVERLVAVLGDLALQFLDGDFVLAAGGFVGLDRGFGVLQDRPGAGQLLLDGGDFFGKGGDFFFQAQDVPVGFLHFHEPLYVGRHGWH